MSAIERYYSMLSPPAGPWCAEDEDDDAPMTAEEEAVFVEQAYQDF